MTPTQRQDLIGLQLPGLVLALDGDQLTGADAAAIATWTDVSGKGNHAAQATGGLRPTKKINQLNGHAIARFGGAHALVTPAIAVTSHTLLLVQKSTVAGMIVEQSASAHANPGFYVYGNQSSSIQSRRSTVESGKDAAANWAATGQWQIILVNYTGTHASNKLRVNLADVSLADTTSTGDPGSATATDVINLGARNQAAAFMTGDIACLRLFTPALSTADARALEAWAKAKFGL